MDYKKQYLEKIQEWRDEYAKFYNGKKLSNTALADILGISRVHFQRTLSADYPIDKKAYEDLAYRLVAWINSEHLKQYVTETDLKKDNNVTSPIAKSKTIRQPKIADNPEREGVIFVPIAAQANYVRHYTERTYIDQLERIYIPGFPYRGDRYRIFEVAGDSMEPTFKEGYYVVTEYMEPTFWHSSISNYYVYVVVTESQVMLKRIYKKSSSEYVMISDNEEYHDQFVLPVEEIKEIWYVRRKIDWEMPPPKKFEIKV